MAGAAVLRLPEPLRLPRGSVRGTIAVIVSVAYGYLLLQDAIVPTVLVNSVVVVVAFYFGTHAASGPTPVIPGQPPPPRPRFVRVVLCLGFLGLAVWFLVQNPTLRGIPRDLLSVLEVLGGYILGATASWLVHRRAHESPRRRRFAVFFRDVSAAGALALTAYMCYAIVAGQATVFRSYAEDALSVVVTYYFGSRVIGH